MVIPVLIFTFLMLELYDFHGMLRLKNVIEPSPIISRTPVSVLNIHEMSSPQSPDTTSAEAVNGIAQSNSTATIRTAASFLNFVFIKKHLKF